LTAATTRSRIGRACAEQATANSAESTDDRSTRDELIEIHYQAFHV
jgi:hypothetical protein